jgi:hypothetical protein
MHCLKFSVSCVAIAETYRGSARIGAFHNQKNVDSQQKNTPMTTIHAQASTRALAKVSRKYRSDTT